MNTLSTVPLAPLLDKLFADAESSKSEFMQRIGHMTDDERARLRTIDPFTLYSLAKDVHLAVS